MNFSLKRTVKDLETYFYIYVVPSGVNIIGVNLMILFVRVLSETSPWFWFLAGSLERCVHDEISEECFSWFVKTENLSCNTHICEFYKRRRRQKLEQTFDKIQMWCLWLCRHFKVNLSMHIAQSKNTLWDQIKVRYICVLTTSFTEWILKTVSIIYITGRIG